MTTTEYAIELDNIALSFPMENTRLQVLNNVSVTINTGETVAILGPSGCGKTSLLLLLAGLEQADEGSVNLDGKDLAQLSADEMADLRRDNLGIIFQSFHLVPSLTALGNVALPLQIAGVNQGRQRAQEMLEKVGLGDRQGHYPGQLSGGEQQRVAIARALVHTPKLVLADEPTGNLDVQTGEKISSLLFALNREIGSTLVMVTHDQQLANNCQRVLRLKKGHLIEDSGKNQDADTDALSV